MNHDSFAPGHEPARTIYSALIKEQEKREEHGYPLWIEKEREVVFQTAKALAPIMGLRAPTLEEVITAENMACGHVDYPAKFAYGVTDAMRRTNKETE